MENVANMVVQQPPGGYAEQGVFSLNRILTYKAYNGIILYETKLHDYYDYIRRLKTDDLSKIATDNLDLNNIAPAINVIDSINNCIGSKVCRKIELQTK